MAHRDRLAHLPRRHRRLIGAGLLRAAEGSGVGAVQPTGAALTGKVSIQAISSVR